VGEPMRRPCGKAGGPITSTGGRGCQAGATRARIPGTADTGNGVTALCARYRPQVEASCNFERRTTPARSVQRGPQEPRFRSQMVNRFQLIIDEQFHRLEKREGDSAQGPYCLWYGAQG